MNIKFEALKLKTIMIPNVNTKFKAIPTNF